VALVQMPISSMKNLVNELIKKKTVLPRAQSIDGRLVPIRTDIAAHSQIRGGRGLGEKKKGEGSRIISETLILPADSADY